MQEPGRHALSVLRNEANLAANSVAVFLLITGRIPTFSTALIREGKPANELCRIQTNKRPKPDMQATVQSRICGPTDMAQRLA
jgi:hypothetical protein